MNVHCIINCNYTVCTVRQRTWQMQHCCMWYTGHAGFNDRVTLHPCSPHVINVAMLSWQLKPSVADWFWLYACMQPTVVLSNAATHVACDALGKLSVVYQGYLVWCTKSKILHAWSQCACMHWQVCWSPWMHAVSLRQQLSQNTHMHAYITVSTLCEAGILYKAEQNVGHCARTSQMMHGKHENAICKGW